MPARVGAIVPVRAPAPYLAEALDGILGQDPPPERVVVVDDGSPEPLALAPGHARRCELLRVAPGGPGHARAAALAALDTDMVALCDADDVWEPGSLTLRVAALEDEPAAALCCGHALIVGPDGAATGERWEELAPGAHRGGELLRRLYAVNPILTSSVVLRRAALEGVELDTGLRRSEDWDLWLQLAGRGWGIVSQPRAVVRYRRHAAALTADIPALARSQLAVHERHRHLVDPELARRVMGADLAALGHGLIREHRFSQGRLALAQAARLAPPSPRDRAARWLCAVPGLRRVLGRGDPYRRREPHRR